MALPPPPDRLDFKHLLRLQNAGLFAAKIAAGHSNDTSGASAANPGGYAGMLWFFGALSAVGPGGRGR